MRYAVHIHACGDYADPRRLAELAREAEGAGWDGVFVNDHLAAHSAGDALPVANPWIALAAIALATERVRIGPMVAALPRRRPWQVAGEAATLDRLSQGRLILGAGSGTPVEDDFAPFGETVDLRARAAMLEESLDILAGLWGGAPFRFQGQHYRVDGAVCLPRPVQVPRIPVWLAGSWPHRRPFRRAARWDGVFVDSEGVDWQRGQIVPLDVLQECLRFTLACRPADAVTPFDVVIGGRSPEDPTRGAARLAPYVEAGLTWWVEGIHPALDAPAALREIVRRGPPRARDVR